MIHPHALAFWQFAYRPGDPVWQIGQQFRFGAGGAEGFAIRRENCEGKLSGRSYRQYVVTAGTGEKRPLFFRQLRERDIHYDGEGFQVRRQFQGKPGTVAGKPELIFLPVDFDELRPEESCRISVAHCQNGSESGKNRGRRGRKTPVRPVVTAAEFPLAGGIEMNPVGIGGQLFRGNEADLRQFRRGGPVSGIDAFFAFALRLLGEAA